jgi:hypothetical protein
MTYLPISTFTTKQHADFIDFKHYFRFSTHEQMLTIPEKIRTILTDWRENLQEFIAACIEEHTNDFEDTWLYDLPHEYREMIRIEEARIQTHDIVKMLTEQNAELKQNIAELKQQHTMTENKMKNMEYHVSCISNIYDSVPITRHTAVNMTHEDVMHIFNKNPQQPIANLTRQHANQDDDLPEYYWDKENVFF